MLFDTRARGRRRTIQVIYLGLAILMGGGLILFGIGGATSGGLLDAFKSNGGGGGGSNALQKNVDRAEKRVHVQPRNPAAWAELARAQYQVAGLGDNYDQTTGAFTAKGRRALVKVEHAWDHYLSLDPPKPNADLASLMVQAFSSTGLNRPAKAVAAQEIVVDARPPSAGLYSTLAILAYQAGQTRKGDLAAGKAVELAPKDQRSTLRDQLKAAKQQAAQPSTTSG